MVEKKKFRCGACNWKFSRNFQPTLCPYCGRAAVEVHADSDAKDIVREVEELSK